MDALLFLALALGLGIKHAFDADHLLAVSALGANRDMLLGGNTGLLSAVAWSTGHMATAGLVSLGLWLFADTLLPSITNHFELVVGPMLVAAGLLGLVTLGRRIHRHRHDHGGNAHTHLHVHGTVPGGQHHHGLVAGLGAIQGLASNDELLTVLVIGLGAGSLPALLLGTGLFSLGVAGGMVGYNLLARAIGRTVAKTDPILSVALPLAVSVATVGYGAYLMAGGAGVNVLGAIGF